MRQPQTRTNCLPRILASNGLDAGLSGVRRSSTRRVMGLEVIPNLSYVLGRDVFPEY